MREERRIAMRVDLGPATAEVQIYDPELDATVTYEFEVRGLRVTHVSPPSHVERQLAADMMEVWERDRIRRIGARACWGGPAPNGPGNSPTADQGES